jgi:predicted pyridoxine 5'-phosphate oxidase superfamily flavin-nucleotide-binding protein
MTTPHITTLTVLRQLYGCARERSLKKEIPALDAHAVQFIGLSPFVVIASGGESGDLDASPRGGEPGFVKVLDASRCSTGGYVKSGALPRSVFPWNACAP